MKCLANKSSLICFEIGEIKQIEIREAISEREINQKIFSSFVFQTIRFNENEWKRGFSIDLFSLNMKLKNQ